MAFAETLSQTLNDTVDVFIGTGEHSLGFYVTIPTGATITFQGSHDGATFHTIDFRDSTDTLQTTTTTSGIFRGSVHALSVVRFLTSVGGSADGTVVGRRVDAIDPNPVLESIDASTTLVGLATAIYGTEQYSEATTTGFPVAVRKDTLATLVDADTDLTLLQVNASGAQYTDPTSSVSVNTGVRDATTQRVTVATDDLVPANVTQLGSTAISMNTGVRDAGTQRVTIATDDSVPTTSANDVTYGTGVYAEATSAGPPLAVRNDTLATLVDTDNEMTLLQVDASGALYTNPSSSVSVNTGVRDATTQRVTVATDDLVPANVTQLGSTAISMNTGIRDAGTQRVTIATDDSVPVTSANDVTYGTSLYTEASTAGPALAVRTDVQASLANTTNELTLLQCDNVGNLRTLPADYNLEVRKGTVDDGAQYMVALQGNTTVLGTTRVAISPLSTGGDIDQSSIHAAAGTVKVSSSDANDTSAGTGLRTLTLEGLDGSGNTQSETITMNGQTEVTSANTYTAINRLTALTTGGTYSNEGTVYCGNGTVTAGVPADKFQTMRIGMNKSATSQYCVPLGKTAYGIDFCATVQSANKDVEFYLETSSDGQVWITQRTVGIESGASFACEMKAGMAIAAQNFVRVSAVSSGASTAISVEIALILV